MGSRGRRQRKKKAKQRALLAASRKTRLVVRLKAVEITLGHDGYLRGHPEPTLLVFAYAVTIDRSYMLGRALRRLDVTGSYPCEAVIAEQLLFRAEILSGVQRIALLCLALEEDSGRDIELLYARLAHAETLQLWDACVPVPQPRAIAELGDAQPSSPPVASRVQLMHGGEDVASLCRRDDWIDAAVVVWDPAQPTHRHWRCPLVSANGRNDWTAHLEIG
jgi:hypothetical protein